MYLNRYIFWCAIAATSTALGQTPEVADSSTLNSKEYRDYSKQDFKLDLSLLRGGAHDKSNVNDYYFTAKLYGVINSLEERKMSIAERKKVEQDLGQFGTLQVNALHYWRANPKDGDVVELLVSGDTLRELVARTMITHKIPEEQAAVRMDIELWEVEKSFMFFGEDTKVAEVHFFPIPETRFDTPARTNQNLEMSDNHGALVKFSVIYESPINSATRP